ncbi:NAD(P)-binding protein [Saitoella complicata NRRL Y-17804]|nr:NAD(P)-binding protein [Saitoella complicata NRRL Y-17804]ODQ53853.1 NAD(P)-binding protein [Saitoella complicata NRRL Y-17804]
MSSKINVAVIGGLGNLGREIALASIERGHSVRVLTRSATVSDAAAVEALEKAGAVIIKVDYDTEESVLRAFDGIDTVVTLAPAFTLDAIDGQKRWIQLAIKAGVKRWVPNEFGTAPTSSLTQSPIFGLRTSLRQYLIEHQSLISHTFFYCGYFTEYITHRSGFGINLDAKTADLEGEGIAPVSWTSRRDVGKFVASALGRDESKNAEVRICGDVKSLGEVVEMFEREMETNFAVTKHTLEESETRHAEKKCSIFALIIAKGGAYVGRGGKYVEPAEHDLRGDLNLDNHVYQDWETWKVEDGVRDYVDKKKEGQEVKVSMEGGR